MTFYIGTQETTNIISLILVVVTGIYVFLTWRIAKSNSDMQVHANKVYIQTRAPIISVRPAVRHSVMTYLVIENLGRTPARNMRLQLDRDFFQLGEFAGNNLRSFEAFNTPIPQFGPGERMAFELSQGFNFENKIDGVDLTPKVFSVLVKYEYEGGEVTEKSIVDLQPFMHSTHPKSIEERLEDIEGHLKKIAAAK